MAGNNYPDLHTLQRGMKFATQISPSLNLYCIVQLLISAYDVTNSQICFKFWVQMFNNFDISFENVHITHSKCTPKQIMSYQIYLKLHKLLNESYNLCQKGIHHLHVSELAPFLSVFKFKLFQKILLLAGI